MSPNETAIVADLALRLEARPPARRARARLAIAILMAVLIDVALVGLVAFENAFSPAPPAPEAEIPVEIVVEPPPPPPEPPAPSPSPTPSQEAQPQPQPEEKPATEAPREGKADHDDEHAADKPTPAAEAPPAPQPSTEPKPAEAAPPPAPELPKAAEAETPEAPKPAETPAEAEAEKPAPKAAPAGLPKSYASVPDVDFGGEAMKAPVSGGAAKATYLTVLYGLIVPRLHVPPVARAYGHRLSGAIGFSIDARGRLVQRFVAEGSGSTELDEAAMEAVASAARNFPPPPRGAPMGIKFTYSTE